MTALPMEDSEDLLVLDCELLLDVPGWLSP
jgi:hypothetical protein